MDFLENYHYNSNSNTNLSNPNEFTSINNYFNLKLCKNINLNDYIYSPYSISYLTLLIYLGSTETTKDELANLFGINSSKDDAKIIADILNKTDTDKRGDLFMLIAKELSIQYTQFYTATLFRYISRAYSTSEIIENET